MGTIKFYKPKKDVIEKILLFDKRKASNNKQNEKKETIKGK